MSKKLKTQKEKLQIIEEASKYGSLETARKYGVGYSTLMKWKQLFEAGGTKFLESTSSISSVDIKNLIKQNQQLKELVAEKELHIRIQNELLKKNK